MSELPNVRNILIVNVNWLGDALFSLNFIEQLHDEYPKAKITVLGPKRIRDVFNFVPAVSDFIVFDEKKSHRSLFKRLAIVSLLRKEKFDAVFLLHQSFTRCLLMTLAGIPHRVGFSTSKGKIFLTHQTKRLDDLKVHRSDIYANLLRAVNIEVKPKKPTLHIQFEERSNLESWYQSLPVQNKLVLVIHTGGNWDLKQWPQRQFASFIKRNHAKYQIILTGVHADQQRNAELAKLSDSILNLTANTTFAQLMYLLTKANYFLSADSGPLHLASMVGCRCIALFGPTRPELTGPVHDKQTKIIQHDVGCNRKPCYHLECTNNNCMNVISVKEVEGAFETF